MPSIFQKIKQTIDHFISTYESNNPEMFLIGNRKDNSLFFTEFILNPNYYNEIKSLMETTSDLFTKNINNGVELVDFTDAGENSKHIKNETDPDEFTLLKDFNCDNTYNFEDFLKGTGFKNRFLVIKIYLDRTDPQKYIFIFRKIPSSYYNLKKKFLINNMRESKQLKIIDSKIELLLDSNFDFYCYIDEEDPTNSEFYIRFLKSFEEFFSISEKYENSYIEIQTLMNFVNWVNITPTDNLKRYCYRLDNFSRKNESIDKMQEKLIISEDNLLKTYFETKEIDFEINSDVLTITPINVLQIKSIIKAALDLIVKTFLLDRPGIVENVPNLSEG